jgi:transcription-repair coupling factor (superfamily II helicase)
MALLDPILPEADAPLVKWGKLYGAAAALAISEAAAHAKTPILVIAPNSRSVESLADEVRFFAGATLPVHVFPDLETLPYDSFSAHPDITSARLATLAELPRARHGVWLIAIDTLLQRLAPRSYIDAYTLKVHVGERGSPRPAMPRSPRL